MSYLDGPPRLAVSILVFHHEEILGLEVPMDGHEGLILAKLSVELAHTLQHITCQVKFLIRRERIQLATATTARGSLTAVPLGCKVIAWVS